MDKKLLTSNRKIKELEDENQHLKELLAEKTNEE